MLSSHEPSVFAAALAARLAYLTTLPEFRTHVWTKLTPDERWRLYALRQQALHGDAPAPSPQAPAQDDSTGAAGSAASTSHLASPPGPAVAWFDLSGRVRQRSWEALRGTMTPLVAVDTFCAEVLAVLDAHPCPALLPHVESAVRHAASLAADGTAAPRLHAVASTLREAYVPIDSSTAYQRESSSPPSTTASTTASSDAKGERGPASTAVFVVRALEGDPAAVMLLWVCRAYAIPHDFAFEPLMSLLSPDAARRSAEVRSAENAPVVFAEASDHFPFESAVCPRVGANGASRSTAREALAQAAVVVTDPVSAAALLADYFLPGMANWCGVPLVAKANAAMAASAEARVGAAHARAVWLDDMRAVTLHVRGPIMALQLDAAARECLDDLAAKARVGAAADQSHVAAHQASIVGREMLLREAAAHLQRYETYFVRRRLREAIATTSVTRANSVPSVSPSAAAAPRQVTSHSPSLRPWFLSLTESGAAEQLVRGYMATGAGVRLVNMSDLYTATCAYVLCTSERCRDLLPLQAPRTSSADSRDPAPLTGDKRRVDLFQPTSAWSASASFQSTPQASRHEISPPARAAGAVGTPVRLAGVPDRVNQIANALLGTSAVTAAVATAGGAVSQRRSDADNKATLEALREVRMKLHPGSTLHGRRGAVPTSSLAEASLAMLKMNSQVSHAAEQLIRARLHHGACHPAGDDGDASETTTCPVLATIFTRAWAFSQSQLPGFPYLWLDPRFGHFLADLVVTERPGAVPKKTTLEAAAATRRSGDGFHVRKAPETSTHARSAAVATTAARDDAMVLGSWQSKMQEWWRRVARQGVASTSTPAPSRTGEVSQASDTASTAPARTLSECTQVLQQDGRTVAPAKL